jgi:hypothetical protein
VRIATIRALEALSNLREPPTEFAIKAAAAANSAAAAGAAAEGASAPCAVVDAPEGVSYIAAEVAKLTNLPGALVTAALQDENWWLRLCACRVVSILCSPPHEAESDEGDVGEDSWAFVAKISEHEEHLTHVSSLSPPPSLLPSLFRARALHNFDA